MANTSKETLCTIDLKIEQLKKQKKELLNTAKTQERKARNRRLIILGSRVEAAYDSFGMTFKGSNEVPEGIKEAVYRYIRIGKMLENVLGLDLTDESVPRFEEFIKDQEKRGKFVSHALFKN